MTLIVGGNVTLLQLWGKENAPYIQALHFIFGVGALVGPLVAEPFLSTQYTPKDNDQVGNSIFY